MRRFTLVTIILLLLALIAVGIYQLSLGTSVEERLKRNGTPPAGPSI